jgi:hypothetical protein
VAHQAIGRSASRDLDWRHMRWLALLAAIVVMGIAMRWLFLATRQSRQRGARARAAAQQPQSARARLMALAAWPVFMILVAGAIALGLIAGMLVGRH